MYLKKRGSFLPPPGCSDLFPYRPYQCPPEPPGPPGPVIIPNIIVMPTVQRYFYIANSDIQAPASIPASQFTNDDGELAAKFPDLGQNSYSNLYINGMLQEGSLYSISTSVLTINPKGTTIFSGTPIALEIVQFSARIIP